MVLKANVPPISILSYYLIAHIFCDFYL